MSPVVGGRGGSRSSGPSGRPRRARRPSSTAATRCWAVAASRRLRAPEGAMLEIGPAPILAVIVGVFHVALYVLVRGTARGQLLFLVPPAILGPSGEGG